MITGTGMTAMKSVGILIRVRLIVMRNLRCLTTAKNKDGEPTKVTLLMYHSLRII